MDIVKKAKKKPMSHATTICDSVCWRNIMRLVPTMPEINTTKENHQIGLKVNRKAKASNAPATPPMAASCIETFHQTLMRAQTTCINTAATRMLPMK